MGKLIVDESMTLDGVIQAPGGPDEDRSSNFAHGGWQAPLLDDESMEVVVENIERSDALLLGRRTDEIFANYWPKASAEDPIARKLNAMPKHVDRLHLFAYETRGEPTYGTVGGEEA